MAKQRAAAKPAKQTMPVKPAKSPTKAKTVKPVKAVVPAKTVKPVAVLAPTPATDGWLAVDGGYAVNLRDGKVVCRNPKGKELASVPPTVAESPPAEQLDALSDWLDEHRREFLASADGWMLRSLPLPTAVVAAVWPDPAWRAALENTVVPERSWRQLGPGAPDRAGDVCPRLGRRRPACHRGSIPRHARGLAALGEVAASIRSRCVGRAGLLLGPGGACLHLVKA